MKIKASLTSLLVFGTLAISDAALAGDPIQPIARISQKDLD